MVRFTAEDIIYVYKQRQMLRLFLQYVQPVSVLDTFKLTPPLPKHVEQLMKLRTSHRSLDGRR